MVIFPARVQLLLSAPAAPVQVPPVNMIVVVPLSAPVVVIPPVFQLNAPLITVASEIVVKPEMVTS